MKAQRILIVLFFFSLIVIKFSSAQNEIENYKLPKLIEGNNLYFDLHPGYHTDSRYDTIKTSNLYISLNLNFYKWRLTRNLDYSIHLNTRGSFDWSKFNSTNEISYRTRSFSHSFGEGGVSYYLIKNLIYTGLYSNINLGYLSEQKPSYNVNLFPFIGLGRFENAGRVIYKNNFEQVLLDEGVITKKLPSAVSRKMTVLLDKKRNDEFKSKYQDDADIEFFSQIEKLLLDEKVIEHPFDARTTLKLYQTLTNNKFIYFPRYKGFSAQAELNYHNISWYEDKTFKNSLVMLLSGVYGVPIGYKTNLVFTGFAGFPLVDSLASYVDYSFYHSPQIVREQNAVYALDYNSIGVRNEYSYIAGVKFLSYFSLSYTSGISGLFQYTNGFVNNGKSDYSVNAVLEFRYNILSRLLLTSYINFYRDQTHYTSVSTGFDISYIVF